MRVRGGGENGQRGAGRAIAPGHDEQGLKDGQESQVVFIVLTWPAGCLGHCEEHLAQPALTPVSFSCALRGMARLWLVCRLWHMLFPQSGRPFLCLLYLTTISTLEGSDQPSLSPLLLPFAPTCLPVTRGSLGTNLLFYPVCLTQCLACGRPQQVFVEGNEIS